MHNCENAKEAKNKSDMGHGSAESVKIEHDPHMNCDRMCAFLTHPQRTKIDAYLIAIAQSNVLTFVNPHIPAHKHRCHTP